MEDELVEANPVGIWTKSRVVLEYSAMARLSAHTDWISSMYLFASIPSSSILRPHLYKLHAKKLLSASVETVH